MHKWIPNSRFRNKARFISSKESAAECLDGFRARGWRAPVALLLLSCALLNSGCADDAFLPPPENLPPGQSAPSDNSPQPLQPQLGDW
jgi:hypothetical protein